MKSYVDANKYVPKNARKGKFRHSDTRFSSYLKNLCETAKRDSQATFNEDGSRSASISCSEIEQYLINTFSFLRLNRKPLVEKEPSQRPYRYDRDGNCLTVYSNLDVAPIQKPFRKTAPEDMSTFLKNVVERDPTLKHLLTHGGISIFPVSDFNGDTSIIDNVDSTCKGSQGTKGKCTSTVIDTSSCSVYRKLLKITEMVNEASSTSTIEDVKLDMAKVFPDVFSATQKKTNHSCQKKLKYMPGELECISDKRRIIDPRDVLEVCIQEDDLIKSPGMESIFESGLRLSERQERLSESYNNTKNVRNGYKCRVDDVKCSPKDERLQIYSEKRTRYPQQLNYNLVDNSLDKYEILAGTSKKLTINNFSEIHDILRKFGVKGIIKVQKKEASQLSRHTKIGKLVKNSSVEIANFNYEETSVISQNQHKVVNAFANENVIVHPPRRSVTKKSQGSQSTNQYACHNPKYLPLTKKYISRSLSQQCLNRIIKNRVRRAVSILSGRRFY